MVTAACGRRSRSRAVEAAQSLERLEAPIRQDMGGVFGLLSSAHGEDDGRYTRFVWCRSKRFDGDSDIGVVGGHDDLQFVTSTEMHQSVANEHVFDGDSHEGLQRVRVWRIHGVHPQPGSEVRSEAGLLTPYLRRSDHEIPGFLIDRYLAGDGVKGDTLLTVYLVEDDHLANIGLSDALRL